MIGSTERIIHRFEVKDGKAAGYDEDGKELVTDPVIERPARDARIAPIVP